MENKIYSFSTTDAVEYGVDCAILLHNIRYWLDHARAHEEMKQDGYYWMFATATGLQNLFPFWTVNKIRKMIKSLESKGALISGEYNKSAWNRTKWYTMPEFADVAKRLPRDGENATSTCSEMATSLYDKYKDSSNYKEQVNSGNINYSEVEKIYNESMPEASNIAKITPARKVLIKKFFTEFNLTNESFKNYLVYMAETNECHWLFERRPKNDGSGQYWGKAKFEYFLSEKCFLNVKENL